MALFRPRVIFTPPPSSCSREVRNISVLLLNNSFKDTHKYMSKSIHWWSFRSLFMKLYLSLWRMNFEAQQSFPSLILVPLLLFLLQIRRWVFERKSFGQKGLRYFKLSEGSHSGSKWKHLTGWWLNGSSSQPKLYGGKSNGFRTFNVTGLYVDIASCFSI